MNIVKLIYGVSVVIILASAILILIEALRSENGSGGKLSRLALYAALSASILFAVGALMSVYFDDGAQAAR